MDAHDFEGRHPFYFCDTREEASRWERTLDYCFIGEVLAFHWTLNFQGYGVNIARWLMRTGPITLLPKEDVKTPVEQLARAVKRGDTLAAQQIVQGYDLLTTNLYKVQFWVIFTDACVENHLETAVWFADAYKLRTTEITTERVRTAFDCVSSNGNMEFVNWFWNYFQANQHFTRENLLGFLGHTFTNRNEEYANFLVDKIGSVTDCELKGLFASACWSRSLQMCKFLFDKYKVADRMTRGLRYTAFNNLCGLHGDEFELWLFESFDLHEMYHNFLLPYHGDACKYCELSQ